MVHSLEEAYKLIRENGAIGNYTTKHSIRIRSLSGDIVADMMTDSYTDLAEEDNGQIFSAKDWPIIEETQQKC